MMSFNLIKLGYSQVCESDIQNLRNLSPPKKPNEITDKSMEAGFH